MRQKNVLIIRLSAMGDVAMSVPVIAQLAQQDGLRVTVLTRNAFLPLFSKLKDVETFAFTEKYKSFLGIFRLYRKLKKQQKWDAIIDLHDVLRTKILRFLFRLSGAKIAIIKKNRCKKRKLTRKNNKELAQLPFVQNEYASACKRAGFPVETVVCQLYGKNELLSAELLKIVGEKGEKRIGIAPFAKHQAKIYPLEKMEQIIAYFSRKGVKVFLFGGKTDAAVLENWVAKYNHVYSLAGKTSLESELQLMAHLDAVLSMDSANMHLANLVNTPVVSVWGGTHPFAGFVSAGNPKNTIVQRNLVCRPCSVYGNKACYKGTYECMDIAPAEIIRTIEKIIN